MKRLVDVLVAGTALIGLLPMMLLIALAVRLTSRGPALYWSDRVGKGNCNFKMPKFRTMRSDTPAVATHLLGEPSRWITPVGAFLRRTSLDELPQVLCILRGTMSLVGPRPALFNQSDLIGLRTKRGVHLLTPGLTGWAQVNGRDELPIPVKVDYDTWYLNNRTLLLDLKIMLLTLLKVVRREGVQH